ncbi:MAG TPA: pitrilysin family protein, partial [Vicinamibacterales bacterium]|nr:pitrilysin family protein [Vicinamibacterales bacterium]
MGFLLCATSALAQARDWPSEQPPRPLPAHEITFPPYEIRSLANGMRVVAVLHHEQPAVSIRLLVGAGSAQDPKGKGGVANLMASLLDQGTTTRTAQQIADQIDFIGGDLGTGAATDLSFVNAIVMKDSFQTGMELVADVARNPLFATEEIARQKDQILSSLRVNSDDPGYIANVVFDRLVYGFHPYGLPGSGTEESVTSLTREDLQAFHRQYFVPNNMILAIVGDVTSDEAFAAAQRVFGGWARGDLPAATPVDLPPSARRIVVVDKPGTVQTSIRVGQLAIPRKHADYLTWDLTVKILGGEGANRLHQVLRSQYGLTYGAEANAEARKDAGDFVAETDTRTDTTGQALRLMIDEFSRLARERVGERELSDAQAYLAGSFPLTIETPDQIATQVLNVLFYDLPIAEIGTFRERVLAVTPDDIQRVARQYVRPDRLSIVLVGNARAFASQLIEMGLGGYEVISVDQLDLMSPNLKRERQQPTRRGAVAEPEAPPRLAYTQGQVNPRPAAPNAPGGQTAPNAPNAPASASAPSVVVVNDLVQRIVQAKGGLEALKAIRTVVVDADMSVTTARGPTIIPTKTYVVYPDKFRVDATFAGQQSVQAYNAGTAWVRDPAGVSAAPAAMRNDFAATVRRDTFPLLIAAAEGKLTVRQLAEDGAGGAAFKVLEFSGQGLDPVKLYIDRDYRIARQAYATPGPDGRPSQAEEAFS